MSIASSLLHSPLQQTIEFITEKEEEKSILVEKKSQDFKLQIRNRNEGDGEGEEKKRAQIGRGRKRAEG